MRNTRRPSKRKSKRQEGVSRKKCKTCSNNKKIMVRRKQKKSRGLKGGQLLDNYETSFEKTKNTTILVEDRHLFMFNDVISLLINHYNAKINTMSGYEGYLNFPGVCKVIDALKNLIVSGNVREGVQQFFNQISAIPDKPPISEFNKKSLLKRTLNVIYEVWKNVQNFYKITTKDRPTTLDNYLKLAVDTRLLLDTNTDKQNIVYQQNSITGNLISEIFNS